MKIVENEFTKNKKIYALVILIIMISNLFSPYGVLANKVLAAPATGEPYYRLTLLKPSDNPIQMQKILMMLHTITIMII